MEMKRIKIKLKVPGVYNDDKFLIGVYACALLAKFKTFTNEIQSQNQKWLLGTLPNSGLIDNTNSTIQIYSKLIENGTWKKDLTETDHIVALTKLVHEMQGTIRSNTIALTTKAEEQATSQHTKKNSRTKKGTYTVDAWRLVKKKDTVTDDERTGYWCTKDHYSGVIVHNGMQALYMTCKHDTQSKDLDERKSKEGHTNHKASITPSNTPNLKSAKKLAFSESLRTSLCTHDGLSSDAADHIWSDTCKDSGKE